MQVLVGSHKQAHAAVAEFEDAGVRKVECRLETRRAKSAIQIHDPNVIHRARPVGSDRLWLYCENCWGENINFDVLSSHKALSGGFDLSRLDLLKFSGIFPSALSYGYSLEHGYLKIKFLDRSELNQPW